MYRTINTQSINKNVYILRGLSGKFISKSAAIAEKGLNKHDRVYFFIANPFELKISLVS